MFGYIYKITIDNPESTHYHGKYYIGQHRSSSEDDGYFGSGFHIRQYIKKYGKIGLRKEILDWADSRETLNELEHKHVGDLYKTEPGILNLKNGGLGSDFSEEAIRKISEGVKRAKPITYFTFSCQVCGKQRSISKNVRGLAKKFCSRECADKGRVKIFSQEELERRSKYARENNPNKGGRPSWNRIVSTIDLVCKGCGLTFTMRDTAQYRKRQYCSVACRQQYSQRRRG